MLIVKVYVHFFNPTYVLCLFAYLFLEKFAVFVCLHICLNVFLCVHICVCVCACVCARTCAHTPVCGVCVCLCVCVKLNMGARHVCHAQICNRNMAVIMCRRNTERCLCVQMVNLELTCRSTFRTMAQSPFHLRLCLWWLVLIHFLTVCVLLL